MSQRQAQAGWLELPPTPDTRHRVRTTAPVVAAAVTSLESRWPLLAPCLQGNPEREHLAFSIVYSKRQVVSKEIT